MPTPIGGANFQTSSATTSLLFNYYPPTKGNLVVIFLEFSAAITGLTVTDYFGYTTYIAGPSVNNFYCFYAIVQNSNSYYTQINWTGSAFLGMTIEEYSAVTSISATVFGTASGNSGTATISLTTDGASGNVIVAGFGNSSSNAFTSTVGTQRQQSTTYTARAQSVDNSNGSPGSLTCTSTLTSSPWDAIALELVFLIGAVGGTEGTSRGRGISKGEFDNTTAQPLGNNPAVPIYLPYGQTWPRG